MGREATPCLASLSASRLPYLAAVVQASRAGPPGARHPRLTTMTTMVLVQPDMHNQTPEEEFGPPEAGPLYTFREPISGGTLLAADGAEIWSLFRCRAKTFDRRRGGRGRELQITGRQYNIELARLEAYILHLKMMMHS